jgi:hypothetical protein
MAEPSLFHQPSPSTSLLRTIRCGYGRTGTASGYWAEKLAQADALALGRVTLRMMEAAGGGPPTATAEWEGRLDGTLSPHHRTPQKKYVVY